MKKKLNCSLYEIVLNIPSTWKPFREKKAKNPLQVGLKRTSALKRGNSSMKYEEILQIFKIALFFLAYLLLSEKSKYFLQKELYVSK